MELSTHILLVYGYLLLFGWVLIEQLGAPIPSAPVILAAGALSAEHQMNYFLALLYGLVACLIADGTWFYIGRRFGNQVVKLLCKLSMEPTVCVRRTQNSLGGRRIVTIVFSKFIPGVATLVSPLAGQSEMSLGEFLLLDGMGSILWVGSLLLAGRLFGDVLKRNPNLLEQVGRFSGALLLAGIVGFFLVRVWRRRRMLRKLAAARLEPEELKRQIDSGEPIYIVDMRHPVELSDDPHTLPGAHHGTLDTLKTWVSEVPRDRDVVVFCSCPGEVTAAKTALELQKLGVERVRPLRGGYDAWKQLGYPLDMVQGIAPPPLVQLGE